MKNAKSDVQHAISVPPDVQLSSSAELFFTQLFADAQRNYLVELGSQLRFNSALYRSKDTRIYNFCPPVYQVGYPVVLSIPIVSFPEEVACRRSCTHHSLIQSAELRQDARPRRYKSVQSIFLSRPR